MEPLAKKSKTGHMCDKCSKSFHHRQDMLRHMRTTHGGDASQLKSPTCSLQFNRSDNLKRHFKRHNQIGDNQKNIGLQFVDAQGSDADRQDEICSDRTLGGTMTTHTLIAEGLNKFDPMKFLRSKYMYDDLKDVFKKTIKERVGIKWYLSMKIKMSRRKGDEIETAEPHFRGKCQTSLKFEDIEEGLKESVKKMYNFFY